MTQPPSDSPSRLSLRLTGEERLALEKLSGGASLSGYVRAQLFGETTAKRKRGSSDRPVKDHAALAQILALLGRSDISASLSSIAKAAQSGALIWDEESAATLNECRSDLAAIRALLMKALRVKAE